MSNKSPDNADAAGPGTILGEGPGPTSHSPAMSISLAVRHLFGVIDGSENTVEAQDSTTQKNTWVRLQAWAYMHKNSKFTTGH